MEKLIALHRNHTGSIISFETSDGRIISYLKAIQEAECGLLEGVQTMEDPNGKPSLFSVLNPSFDDLPQIY
ncbi:MAG: DUF3892 domain-containing protein [Bacillota bacterium]|nr:DUF3892 domain-containing protein [Bacillota bacterium]